MSPELHQRVRKLFDEALEKPEAERAAFLDGACGGAAEVRQAVERLLEAHRDADSFMASERRAARRLGRYVLGRELGRGAMGVVYEGIDPLIGRSVAIKVIRMDTLAETGKPELAREQLFREAHSAGRLLHPGIVVIFDVGQENDTAFIAMELVEGRSLMDLLAANRRPAPRVTLEILRQAAAALDYAHQNGIVHRDIKPANIMLHKGNAVKIADFGVAKITSLQFRTATGMILGTPTYMSPEQIEMRPLDGRSDQFSLAVVAYEMLTGVRPFVADSLATLAHLIAYAERPSARAANPALSEAADAVLRRGLSKLPEERYPTCAEFITALGDSLWEAPGHPAVSEAVVPAGAQGREPSIPQAASARAAPIVPVAPQGPPPPPSRSAAAWILGVLFVLAALLASGLWIWRGQVLQYWQQMAGRKAPAAAQSAPPQVVRFTASSQSITAGGAALLHWQVLDATEVRIDPQVGRVAAADATEVTPAESTTYTLTAQGPGGRRTAVLSITVNRPPSPPTKADKASRLYQSGLAELNAGRRADGLADLVQAAQLDDLRAMAKLSDLLIDSGNDAEVKEAVRWRRRAAELGDPAAMLQLGALYELGDQIPQDYDMAALWYGKAADKGNLPAIYNLGRMYETGRGVPKDLAKATGLYRRAADQGNPEARIRLSQMSPK